MTLNEAIKIIEPADGAAYAEAQKKWLNVAKPLHSLGRLEELTAQLCAISGDVNTHIDKKALVIMCADNGVVNEGVTQCGQDITAMVTGNFLKRKASVSIMAERAGCELFPVDIGVLEDVPGVTDKRIKIRYGTENITYTAAMSRDEAIRAMEVGISIVGRLKRDGYSLIATGEMGIGNTTTSSAVAAVLLKKAPEEVTGRGAGLCKEGLRRKIDAIGRAISVNRPEADDVTDVLSKVGGLDIAGLCGVFLGGAAYRVPVIIDGFISSVAALCAYRLHPSARDYMIPSHMSKEPGGRLALDALGLAPYLDCGMFLGEGSGAVALMPLIDMAVDVYNDMPTFDSWEGREAYRELN